MGKRHAIKKQHKDFLCIVYTMTGFAYTLEDAENIRTSGFTYTLTQQIQDKIKKLMVDLGDVIAASAPQHTTYSTSDNFQQHQPQQHQHRFRDTSERSGIKKPRFEKNTHPKNQRYTNTPSNTDAVWEKQKAFIATKIEKKEGIEKLINDIRICLNKISTKNYESQKDTIFQYINLIIEKNKDIIENEVNIDPTKLDTPDSSVNDDLHKIAVSIFDTASTNKFYSELYATLYKELSANYPIFMEIIDGFIQTYLENISLIRFVDSSVNYDKFCSNNKENDKRKAMTVFIVNLMKKELYPKSSVLDIIIKLQTSILAYVDLPDKVNEVEEITENIFLFITNIEKECLDAELWPMVVENIKTCSQYKVKEHVSISSRVIFKYKDICDHWKKNGIVMM